MEDTITYYDKYGKPLDLYEWGKLLNNYEYKRINLTCLWWGGTVSTVWLGLNHNIFGRKPLFFETMVFGWKFVASDLDMERYSGLAEARNGHIEMVKNWSNLFYLIKRLFRRSES